MAEIALRDLRAFVVNPPLPVRGESRLFLAELPSENLARLRLRPARRLARPFASVSERQKTAALQNAPRGPETSEKAPAFGLRQSSGALALRVERGCAAQKLDSFSTDSEKKVTLARISHQVLCNAKQMSSGEAAMRARKAKPRPSGWMEPGTRVSPSQGGFGDALTLVFPCPGAVLPQPGFPCHLPGGEKSV